MLVSCVAAALLLAMLGVDATSASSGRVFFPQGQSTSSSAVNPHALGVSLFAFEATTSSQAKQGVFRHCPNSGYGPRSGGYGLILVRIFARGVSCHRATQIGGAYIAGDPMRRGWHCRPALAGRTACRFKHSRRRFHFVFDGDAGKPAGRELPVIHTLALAKLRTRTYAATCGGAAYLEYRPHLISSGCTGGALTIDGIHWRGYGRGRALGTGVVLVQDCGGCAYPTHFARYHATVRLSGRKHCTDGVDVSYFPRVRIATRYPRGNPFGVRAGVHVQRFRIASGTCGFAPRASVPDEMQKAKVLSQ